MWGVYMFCSVAAQVIPTQLVDHYPKNIHFSPFELAYDSSKSFYTFLFECTFAIDPKLGADAYFISHASSKLSR